MAQRISAVDLLSEIEVPVRVVAARRDALIPVDVQRAMAAEIPGAIVDEVDCGHMAPLERPDAVSAALARLIDASAKA
jgi:pimeloyl-ACP methyl ester carboxylesterase